jgi:hypothetical protein
MERFFLSLSWTTEIIDTKAQLKKSALNGRLTMRLWSGKLQSGAFAGQ